MILKQCLLCYIENYYICVQINFDKMTKYILSTLFLILFIAATPVYAVSATEPASVESPNTEITISVNGSKIRVTGANGCTLSVYNVTGVRVMSVKIDSADKQYDLDLPKGCYILQIGKTVRKISIR